MKKYFIVFIILFILMGVFSMDILGRSITDIQRRMVDQTNYRINVVKGIVATVNINKTFGCYIAGETVIYPTIPTFSRDPKLQVGDKVTIEFINGCRETPVILAPEDIRERPDTTELAEVAPLIVAIIYTGGNDYIKVYGLDGVLIDTYDITAENVYYETDCLAIDSRNNIYYIRGGNILVKRDIDGNEIKAEAIAGFPEAIAIGADGCLYTREQDGKVHKRSTSTFTSSSYITLTPGKSYYGLCLDSDGNIYTTNNSDYEIEKWNPAGVKTASRPISNSISSSLGLAGNYIVRATGSGIGYSYKIHKDLGINESDFLLTNIGYQIGVGSLVDKYLFIGVNNGNGHYYLEKFASDDSLDWSTEIDDLGFWDDKAHIAAYPF